ncbi:MAG TPA: AbrB/MazE/SpoVT family DNA-binding domain-containing protein [Candidatus Acidoferrum sp.]|nr:AbrB/MazE/SpoVT family DNA-binding domain-containing protein [Candidatus Acidoferrum sp.]
MRQSGSVRKLDCLGRIVVPVGMRRVLGWTSGTEIEISRFGRYILLHEWEDENAAPVELGHGNPVAAELTEILGGLSDRDMFLALDLLRRLSAADGAFAHGGGPQCAF